ncbi:MAG TPA: BlaI/MecI/CopY family transcriptional regulator [Vicinamibacterales bacterium]|nr:BlaI/MecI/CopY family transcriptional regulator [Vicinamibacterales bacterium]
MIRKLLGGRWFGGAGDPVETALGLLERDVMNVLWIQDDLAVRDVQTRLPRRVAYTTVMTTLDRLYKKGVLQRRQAGRAFLYSAALTRPQLQAQLAGQVLAGLFQARDGAAVPVLSNLVDSVGSQDGGAELLQTLEQLVRDKRRQLKKDKTQ